MQESDQTNIPRSAFLWFVGKSALALIFFAFLVTGDGTRLVANDNAKIIELSSTNRVGKLRVTLGTSETIRVTVQFSDIVVGDPETADVAPLTNQTLYVLGRKLGTTNVTLFDEQKRLVAVIDIEVTHNVRGLQQALQNSIPGAHIRIRSINGRVLLEGEVPSAPAAEKAMQIAGEFVGEDVTNSLTVAANQQVNLEVRFIEASRQAGKELGVNLNLTDNGNGVATGGGVLPVPPSPLPPLIGVSTFSGTLPFGAVLANILGNGISPDVVITALEQKRLARRLAEPNLTTMSGQPASFHAGGEFPIPVAQDDGEIEIEFKEFGVRLTFVPYVLDNGLINLKIEPEVSEIDPTASVRVAAGGVLIPGLSVRRASTNVELRDGQSFAIAGLLQSINQKTSEQVPWLGDVPIIGTLFRSAAFQKRESDLVIIVTPRLVRPVGTREQLHTPLDTTYPSNEPEFFLLGKMEVSKKQLDKEFNGLYGHIIDAPKGYAGVPEK
jgi:pilus assembly protein CpaC